MAFQDFRLLDICVHDVNDGLKRCLNAFLRTHARITQQIVVTVGGGGAQVAPDSTVSVRCSPVDFIVSICPFYTTSHRHITNNLFTAIIEL